ncbi:hypothetical protein [Kitasatospora sp. NPDC098663]|uniref:hypothetical protein n=1 Tax=Kitasatospora sp. NPDC098663 TaxID=3364096 RepID=UPI0038248DF1
MDRALALRQICPLPDGTVTGVQQVARRGDLVVVAALTQTIERDTWNGISVRLVVPAAGKLAAQNWFGFAEHGLFERDSELEDYGRLNRYNQDRLLQDDSISAERLRDAVQTFTETFAPPAPPQFAAAARLDGLWRLARCLDVLGDTTPNALAGRAFAHAEVLRDVTAEINPDLVRIAGERQAADCAPIDVAYGLENLRRLQSSLAELAASLLDPVQAADFRAHAETLAGIDAELTADLLTSGAIPSRTVRRAAATRRTAASATGSAVSSTSLGAAPTGTRTVAEPPGAPGPARR